MKQGYYFWRMKLKVHYIDNKQGEPTAVKIDIEEWNELKRYLTNAGQERETIDFIETPVEIPRMKVQPKKKRSFSDFLLDL